MSYEDIDTSQIPRDIKNFIVLLHRGEVTFGDIARVQAVIHEVCPQTVPMCECFDPSDFRAALERMEY